MRRVICWVCLFGVIVGLVLIAASMTMGQPVAYERPKSDPWLSKGLLDGMTEYKRARYTQSIAVVNGRDSITAHSRESLEEKYRVPGGMVGLTGWKSRFFRSKPAPDVYLATFQVLNSFGHHQPNRGYARWYDEGAVMDDVLINSETGCVFEHRRRTKLKGYAEWKSEIVYRNAEQRPKGYGGIGITKCSSCHQDAGSGSYGAAMVSGSDGVFSDGIPQLERTP